MYFGGGEDVTLYIKTINTGVKDTVQEIKYLPCMLLILVQSRHCMWFPEHYQDVTHKFKQKHINVATIITTLPRLQFF